MAMRLAPTDPVGARVMGLGPSRPGRDQAALAIVRRRLAKSTPASEFGLGPCAGVHVIWIAFNRVRTTRPSRSSVVRQSATVRR